MTRFEVKQAKVPPHEGDGELAATKYPWPEMQTLGVDYFEVPVGSERASAVVRRVRAAGRHWCVRHRPEARPEVRHDAASGVVKCWLVGA